jgi:hypothetical protein
MALTWFWLPPPCYPTQAVPSTGQPASWTPLRNLARLCVTCTLPSAALRPGRTWAQRRCPAGSPGAAGWTASRLSLFQSQQQQRTGATRRSA